MKRLHALSLVCALSSLAAAFACTSTSSTGEAGSGGSCPCTVGNSGIHSTLACGESTCMTLNGSVKGYRCTENGAVEDMSVCTTSGGTDGGQGPSNGGMDAGACSPLACGADGGPECGEADNGCGGKITCPACAADTKCSDSSHCLAVPQNIVVYGDYEGGTFTINVDQDLPQLAIGLVSYRAMNVTITGPYASNVVAVYHAGYNPGSTVTGVDARLFTDRRLPPATVDAGFGNDDIILEEPGGGNPPEQVNAFFVDRFGGGTVKFNECRRGHDQATMLISAGGSC